MKSNLKWTVLAVAISAAAAAQAEDPAPPESNETNIVYNETVNIDDTRNYETNTSNTDFDSNTSLNLELSYIDRFERNTNMNHDVNTTENYTDNFDWSTTIDETFYGYREVVDIDRESDSHEVAVSLKKSLSLSSDIAFSGSPTVNGDINIDSAAIAVVDNRQSVSDNWGDNVQLDNDASIGEGAAAGASGNLQFNTAAGDNNVQDNAAALSAADASFAFGLADAEIFVNQAGVANMTNNLGVTNTASVSGDAFAGAAGNIGVNVASGNNNMQKNALAASVATSAYAQSSVSSNQVSSGNTTTNAPLEGERGGTELVAITLTGTVSGSTSSQGSGSYEGTGNAYQKDNYYLDSWSGSLNHPSGSETGHLDMDKDIQNATMNPYRQGVGGIAFDTDEKGDLSFSEMGSADLQASLSGTVALPGAASAVGALNSASLSGNAFAGASGNIGVNVAAGTGNQQANSLAMAVAQPSTGGGGGGGGVE